MSSHDADERRRRLEEEAYDWVSKIIADRKRHAAGLRAWVGTSEERADIYNEAYRHQTEGGSMGAQAFGNDRQRQANRFMAQIRTIPYRRIIGITVAVMLVGAAASLGISALTGRLLSGHAESQSVEYSTAVGEVRTIVLPDGSRALLDTQSAIRVSFTGAERHIDMVRGRARFTVTHDPRWPFVVLARNVSVTARGTVFDVDMDHAVAVHLITGKVDVAYGGPQQTGKRDVIHLAAGQRVAIDAIASHPPAPPAPAPPSDAQWVTGLETFDDVPAATIIAEANRYSDTKIQLADPADNEEVDFLVVHVRDTRKIARDLATFLKLDVDESQPGLIILRRPK
ncbi:FecR family protein [Sphingomonas oryzagri]